MIREPQATGFYHPDPKVLRKMVATLLDKAQPAPGGRKFTHGVVPHAGYMYSGLAAATLFKNLKPSDRFVILGVDHYSNCSDICIHTYDSWQTPLGKVNVDEKLRDALLKIEPEVTCSSQEHSIEVQLPFLQTTNPKFTFLPITIPHVSMERIRELGSVLARLKTPIIASSDLTHYMPKQKCMELDALAIDQMVTANPAGLISVVRDYDISMCGAYPVAVLLASLPRGSQGPCGELLAYYTSGDVTGSYGDVVGYAAVGFP